MSMNYDGKPGEYTYTQTALGKSGEGIVAVGAQSERDLSAQRNAGGADRQPGDQGGHLVAHGFGGRNDPSNLDPQAGNVNQKDQANVERNVSNLASDPNNTVSLQVSNYNSVSDQRPDSTMINVGVKDNTTGVVDEQHISFQNANHDLQESWSNSATQADPYIAPSQDAGMTSEQRDLANEYSDAENAVDDRLGSGWSYTDFDSSFLDGGAAEVGTSETAAGVGDSSEDGNSSGADTTAGDDNSASDGDGLAE